jgi:RimJ/RimL family protein N-acetyltransferase
MSATLIYGQEERLLPWAQERIGAGPFRRDAYAIGLEREGELVAVVVFDTFSACDAHIHIASDGTRRWMNKELLLATFAYAFTQLKLNRVTGVVPAKNAQAIAFDLHLGFEPEGRCAKALPDDDIIILGMLRERCRFITEEQRHA